MSICAKTKNRIHLTIFYVKQFQTKITKFWPQNGVKVSHFTSYVHGQKNRARFLHQFLRVFSHFLQYVILGAHLQNPFFQVLQVVGNAGKIVFQLKNKTYFCKLENNILKRVKIQQYFSLFFWLICLFMMHQAPNVPKKYPTIHFRLKISCCIECCRQNWSMYQGKAEKLKKTLYH